MKGLAHEEYIDDDFQMDWLSPKRLAELREERKRNPPRRKNWTKCKRSGTYSWKIRRDGARKSPGNKRAPLYIHSTGCR